MNDYELLYRYTLAGDPSALLAEIDRLLRVGCRPIDILQGGLIPAMDMLGEKVALDEVYIPQVLMSARAMQEAINRLEPLILANVSRSQRGTVVIGTVRGDIHNIGKNLVSIMLKSAGCRVIDLGVNVSSDAFIAAIRDNDAHTVALSALLTSSLRNMSSTVRAIQAEDFGFPVRIILGGGPVTPLYAAELSVEFGVNMIDTARKAVAFSGSPFTVKE